MDFVIALVLLAVVVFSLGWVGVIPFFGPGPKNGQSTPDPVARQRNRMERQMREVPDE